MHKHPWRGVFTIPSTPFTGRDRLDEDGLRSIIDFCVECGAHGIVTPVNASEFTFLTDVERFRVAEIAVEQTAGRIPVVIGAGGVSAMAAVGFARHAEEVGADAVIAVSPYVHKLGTEGLYAYYKAISDAVTLPIFVQNHPVGSVLSPEFVARLCREIEHIEYVKEETPPSPINITRILELAGASCRGVMGGAGGRYLFEEYLRGSCGNMPGCHVTDAVVALWNALERGDQEEARRVFSAMTPLFMYEHQMPGTYKFVLAKRGVIRCANSRRGLTPDAIGEAFLDRILEELDPVLTWGKA